MQAFRPAICHLPLDTRLPSPENPFDLNDAPPALTTPIPGAGRRRWRLRASPQQGLLTHVGLPPLIARVLENRGLGSRQDVSLFLGGKEPPERDPYLLPDFAAAVQRLRQAIRDADPVCVFGDFDVDGMTATAILAGAVTDLGGRALPYIPHRGREGYGLNLAAVDAIEIGRAHV